MSDNIPFEIQMEIIKKVPDVGSLIRFRSVSKPWKSFIDSPQCIAGSGVRLSAFGWEMIPSSNLPRQSIILQSTQVVIDRFIYWVAYDRIVADDATSHNKHMIMSFDLISKAFKVVDIPDSIINQFRGGWFFISKLRESLILFGYIRENEMLEDAVCGVWMMVHDGVITSFRRIFTVDTPISSVNEILGFRKRGEPIIEAQKQDSQFATFEVYEPCSQHITNLGI
ncbi:probable galacturonosyltransferase 7 isoform X2 [Tanacetum coccineum]